MDLTQDYIKKYFYYNPINGDFYRIKSERGYSMKIAKKKYKPNKKGYLVVNINKKPRLVHRLIWLYMYGSFPNQIDHINQIKTDNRLLNLRNVSNLTNHKNMPTQKNNTSGHVGVSFQRNRWRARIIVDGKEIYLGVYKNKEDAINARKYANILFGYHQNHGMARPVSP